MLFYSIRPSAGPATPLTGASVDDGLPIQTGDEELLGQVDGVESGEVTGWACLRGYLARPLQVWSQGLAPDSIRCARLCQSVSQSARSCVYYSSALSCLIGGSRP